jgi:Asp-tRNA(Asn)/Glu-tRNA(Gln) amidotransferase A subunit family amidase
VAGYPHISVPATRFEGLPIGLSFFGTAFGEPTLLKLASGYEHIRGRVAATAAWKLSAPPANRDPAAARSHAAAHLPTLI